MNKKDDIEVIDNYNVKECNVMVNNFELPPLGKEYEEIFLALKYKVNPCLQFLTLSMDVYKELTVKMRNFPTHEKYALGSDIRDCILQLRGDLIESVCVPSMAIPCVKKVSSGLYKLKASLTLACYCGYISTPQHYSLVKKIDDLIMLLEMWIKAIIKSKEFKKL